ncbi:MAG: hypothetical protein IJW16_00930 [Clostridia bacterium]|nr:hypothetical protein [Clostridia bacterium]
MKQFYKVKNLKSQDEARKFVTYWDLDLEERMINTARAISKIRDLRFLGLTGPTCSGKTTAAKKLTDYLERHGHRVHVISLDDFYFEKEYLQDRADADPNIEIDYDSEDTIDMGLFAEKIESLMRNDPTELPRFDFKSGLRVKGETIDPDPSDVFLVEGIQVLYPRVNEILRRATYRNIYIYPESAIEIAGQMFVPNEIRLMRRLVRDYHFRASVPEFTFYLWQSVRANEEKSIFPYADSCDYFIDSTMPYEIGMLKPYLEDILAKMSRENAFWKDAEALLDKLGEIKPVSGAYITENSLYKEFI